MDYILYNAGDVLFGFLCRLLIIALVAAIFKAKLGSPHPFWGLTTLYYYITNPSTELSTMFILGFVAIDFSKQIKWVVIDRLLGGVVDTKNSRGQGAVTNKPKVKVFRVQSSKVTWNTK